MHCPRRGRARPGKPGQPRAHRPRTAPGGTARVPDSTDRPGESPSRDRVADDPFPRRPQLAGRQLVLEDHAGRLAVDPGAIGRPPGRSRRAARWATPGRPDAPLRDVAGQALVAQRDRQAGGVGDRDGPLARGERRGPFAAGHVQRQAHDQLPDPVRGRHPADRAASAAGERPRLSVVSGRARSASGSAIARPIRFVPRSTPRRRLTAPVTATGSGEAGLGSRPPAADPRRAAPPGRRRSGSWSPSPARASRSRLRRPRGSPGPRPPSGPSSSRPQGQLVDAGRALGASRDPEVDPLPIDGSGPDRDERAAGDDVAIGRERRGEARLAEVEDRRLVDDHDVAGGRHAEVELGHLLVDERGRIDGRRGRAARGRLGERGAPGGKPVRRRGSRARAGRRAAFRGRSAPP